MTDDERAALIVEEAALISRRLIGLCDPGTAWIALAFAIGNCEAAFSAVGIMAPGEFARLVVDVLPRAIEATAIERIPYKETP